MSFLEFLLYGLYQYSHKSEAQFSSFDRAILVYHELLVSISNNHVNGCVFQTFTVNYVHTSSQIIHSSHTLIDDQHVALK